jgi:hypothetical protein
MAVANTLDYFDIEISIAVKSIYYRPQGFVVKTFFAEILWHQKALIPQGNVETINDKPRKC